MRKNNAEKLGIKIDFFMRGLSNKVCFMSTRMEVFIRSTLFKN